MADFFYDASFFIAAALAIATAWSFITSDGSSRSGNTPDFDAWDDGHEGDGDHDADDD